MEKFFPARMLLLFTKILVLRIFLHFGENIYGRYKTLPLIQRRSDMRRIVYFLFMAMSVFSVGAIEQPVQRSADVQMQQDKTQQDNSYFSDVMNKASDETLVAAHYSHRSHSSHRSHVSSRY